MLYTFHNYQLDSLQILSDELFMYHRVAQFTSLAHTDSITLGQLYLHIQPWQRKSRTNYYYVYVTILFRITCREQMFLLYQIIVCTYVIYCIECTVCTCLSGEGRVKTWRHHRVSFLLWQICVKNNSSIKRNSWCGRNFFHMKWIMQEWSASKYFIHLKRNKK